jgi:hypothetical protein
MSEIFKTLGGRKFILAILIMIILTIFVCLGKMTVAEFITAILVNSGIFGLGNAIQKIT